MHDVYASIFINISHLFGKVHNMDVVKKCLDIPYIFLATMKHGIIVAILKPNKERPYTRHFIQTHNTAKHSLKVIDRLVLNLIAPHFPLLLPQHHFRPQHLRSTLLTQLTQDLVFQPQSST